MLRAELRLGLQEALVNAAKHGNCLNPEKFVSVRYARFQDRHEWIITDEGIGFVPPASCPKKPNPQHLPDQGCECGRGLFILFQVFDQVYWNKGGTELSLSKCLNAPAKNNAALYYEEYRN